VSREMQIVNSGKRTIFFIALPRREINDQITKDQGLELNST
jgi:hypothetical protein